MTKLGYPPVRTDIVEEHFDELDFLWEMRESVVFAPDWTLAELAELEDRAEAQLDGLRLAEGHALEVARPHLEGGTTYAAAAAAMVFLQNEAEGPKLRVEVVGAMRAAEGETLDGIRIGLRYSGIGGIREELVGLAAGDHRAVAVAAAEVLAFQRFELPNLERHLTTDDPTELRLACRALGHLRRFRDTGRLTDLLAGGEPEVQRAALCAAALSGMDGLAQLCRRAASDAASPSLEALGFLGTLGDLSDLPLLEDAARQEGSAAVAIEALGALGRVQAVSLLIELMEQGEEPAKQAAASFERITGLDDLYLERPSPEPIDEADVESEFADDAPLPDPDKARAVWEANLERFDDSSRWQWGTEFSNASSPQEVGSVSLRSLRDLQLSGCAAGREDLARMELELPVRSRETA